MQFLWPTHEVHLRVLCCSHKHSRNTGGRGGDGDGENRPWVFRNFKLRRTKVTNMGEIRLNQSVIYKDLRQRVQRIHSASLPL